MALRRTQNASFVPSASSRVVLFRLGVALAALLATPGIVAAQVPLGPEFGVNTYTPGTQRFRSVTGIPGYVFVVTWDSDGQDGSQYGVFAQRYYHSTPLGGEFRANTYTTGNQRLSRAASDQFNGPYLIVWQSEDQDGDGAGVFGQRYDSGWIPLGPEFRANTYTTSDQSSPDVTFAGSGFMVVWQSDLQDGSSTGIYMQKFGLGGPLGAEFRINTYTTGPQTSPAWGFAGWPSWLSPWTSAQDPDGSLGVYAVPWFDLPVELQDFVVE